MIMFMGVAGSGKSTQGKMLADEQGLPWLSAGEFLRMLISGEKRKAMMAGQLLDDDEVMAILQKVFGLIDVNQEFVLDGFPRTEKQAEWLLDKDREGQLKITSVVHILVSEEIARKRLLGRGRADDYTEAIDERFNEYHHAIRPILERFRNAEVPIHEVNGEQSVAMVHQAVLAAIGKV